MTFHAGLENEIRKFPDFQGFFYDLYIPGFMNQSAW